jgi:hypothetical protein
MATDDRARRIGENEALYRSINERIEDLNTAFGLVTETMSVICECGDLECNEQIELDIPAYEHVRADPTHFVVLPGHELPDVEEVIERHDGYYVLRKDPGAPAQIARDMSERD